MESMEPIGREIARRSAITYTAISLLAALLFFGAATWKGGYSEVARWGGAAWVFLLSMIVTMPLVTTYYRKRGRHTSSGGA
ncbi:hypothetical protein [Thermoflexus sp.]|uniref:hypothetical protein n=1 Tax=Thermoflexus sp. TaxID=1969742 RepID=UPI0035E44461